LGSPAGTTLNIPVLNPNTTQEVTDLLLAAGQCAAAPSTKLVDAADVVILAGEPLPGLARRVADRIPVPVVDQAAAAVSRRKRWRP
jgi:Asp/Glu/hydantoin racemase